MHFSTHDFVILNLSPVHYSGKEKKDSGGAHGQPVISSQETSCVLCVILFPKDFSSPLNISLPFARSHCIGGVEASRTGLSVGKDSIMWPETLPDALSNAGFPSIWSVGVLLDTFWSCKIFHSHISIYLLFPCFHVNWSLLTDHFIQGYVLVFLNGYEREKKALRTLSVHLCLEWKEVFKKTTIKFVSVSVSGYSLCWWFLFSEDKFSSGFSFAYGNVFSRNFTVLEMAMCFPCG